LGSRDTGRGQVLVETTVTLKEESTEDFRPTDSETELTTFEDGTKRPNHYGWKINSPSGNKRNSLQ
jgi:hypothetical protein